MLNVGVCIKRISYLLGNNRFRHNLFVPVERCNSKYCLFADKLIAGNSQLKANLKHAKRQAVRQEMLNNDDVLQIPEQISEVLNFSPPALTFYESLKTNKSLLMQKLNLTWEEYDCYARLALKIAKEESNYGLGIKYALYNQAEKTELGRKIISSARRLLRGEDYLSFGMTRFKIGKASPEEKGLFNDFGITYSNATNILDPEKSAIATMIHIESIGRQYCEYLKQISKQQPDLGSKKVQKSIINAKKLLFDDKLRPDLIKIIKTGKESNFKKLKNPRITSSDIEDLKIYARSVILSKEAFISAVWNGRKFIPCGNGENYAYANLLNLAAQKGYLANIDTKSRVFY